MRVCPSWKACWWCRWWKVGCISFIEKLAEETNSERKFFFVPHLCPWYFGSKYQLSHLRAVSIIFSEVVDFMAGWVNFSLKMEKLFCQKFFFSLKLCYTFVGQIENLLPFHEWCPNFGQGLKDLGSAQHHSDKYILLLRITPSEKEHFLKKFFSGKWRETATTINTLYRGEFLIEERKKSYFIACRVLRDSLKDIATRFVLN